MHSLHQLLPKHALDGTITRPDTSCVTALPLTPAELGSLTAAAAPTSTSGQVPTIWGHQWLGPVAVSVAAAGFGLSPYFATKAFDSGITPFAASFMRVAMLMVAVSPWARGLRGWAREATMVASAGAVSMIGFAGFYVALNQAPVAAATMVYFTYPVVVLGLSSIVWKRRLLRWEAIACGVVVLGVALAVGSIELSRGLLVALAPAFAAPIGWAVFLVVLGGPCAAMPTVPKVFAGACGGAGALLPIAIWQTHGSLMPVTAEAATSMVLLSLCTLVMPALLITWGASRSGEKVTAMAGSFELVVAVGAGWMVTGEGLSMIQLIGVSLVFAGACYSACRGARGQALIGGDVAPKQRHV